MTVALYFGSFNPIHIGHIAISEYIVGEGMADEVWLIVSPHNPLKDSKTLANEQSRLEMANLAFADSIYNKQIVMSDIEFGLSKPSYTINTLTWLKTKYPTCDFKIVIGEDNLAVFEKWKDWELILQQNELLVYPRLNSQNVELMTHPNVTMMNDAPLYPIESTMIRDCVKNKMDINKLTKKTVVNYIKTNKLYE